MTALLPDGSTAPLPLRLVYGTYVFYGDSLAYKLLGNVEHIAYKFFVIHFRQIAGVR